MSSTTMSSADPPRRRLLWDAASELLGVRPRVPPRAHAAPSVHSTALDLAAIVESLPDPMLVVIGTARRDQTGWRYVLANAAARDTLRISRPEGSLVTVLRDPAVLEAVGCSLFDGKASEAAYETAGANEVHWQVLTRPLTVAGGEHTALLILRDETQARRAERTRVDFLANAGHELRTPLASLLGFIETLRGHARTDEVAREKFLGIMQGQAERMSRLIDDLMSLSRIELNEHVPPGGETDVSQAVLDVLDALSPIAAELGVRMSPTLPQIGQAIVTGDRDQIIQVAQNLVDNALKYTPRGGEVLVTVEVGVDPTQEPASRLDGPGRHWLLSPTHDARQRYVAIRVKDAGPGIERAHLPRLSERFYRVEGQKSGERAGTGLGLAIVKHIANRHRGGLLVESKVGEGASFTVFLPQGGAPGGSSL